MKFLAAILGLLGSVPTALAQGPIQDYVDTTTLNSSWAIAGGASFREIFLAVVYFVQPFIWIAAVIAITIAGIRMVVGQEDDAVEKGKSIVIACVTGVILSFLIPPLVTAFVDIQGTSGIINTNATTVVSNEFLGIIDWALSLAGVLGVMFIIVSSLKAIAKPLSGEESVENIRLTIKTVVVGLIILTARVLITVATGGTGQPDPTGIILIPVKIAEAILFFIGVIAVAIVMYAGLLMLVSFGNEERVSQGKSLLTRAVIGLVLIAVSYALIHFVVAVVA
jgi:hypothetical protein